MKSAKKSLSDVFFLSQRSHLSDIENYDNNSKLFPEEITEMQQHISVLEKKLQEQQQLNNKQSIEINDLKKDVSSAKQLIMESEQNLDVFYQELKQKETQLNEYQQQIRNKEMEMINKELCWVNKDTQTDNVSIEFEEQNEVEVDVELANKLWEKKIQYEYKQIMEIRQQLKQREEALNFREEKIKQFMQQIKSQCK